jgi:hypothetical protein
MLSQENMFAQAMSFFLNKFFAAFFAAALFGNGTYRIITYSPPPHVISFWHLFFHLQIFLNLSLFIRPST